MHTLGELLLRQSSVRPRLDQCTGHGKLWLQLLIGVAIRRPKILSRGCSTLDGFEHLGDERARLFDRALAEQQAQVAASRAAQVGTGERAEKIRTYNFQEKRVKDHRINLLVHNLDAILMGELDELTAALQDDEKRRRLEERAVA